MRHSVPVILARSSAEREGSLLFFMWLFIALSESQTLMVGPTLKSYPSIVTQKSTVRWCRSASRGHDSRKDLKAGGWKRRMGRNAPEAPSERPLRGRQSPWLLSNPEQQLSLTSPLIPFTLRPT
ncbi:unnamed protein product [Leuciscus chuanchicus]